MRLIGVFLLLFLFSCKPKPELTEIKVSIQPFQDPHSLYTDSISSALKRLYSIQATVLNPIDFPKGCTIKYYSGHRYRADQLIAYLKNSKDDSLDYIIGFTSKDISTTKNGAKDNSDKYFDWGIFGLGYRPGPSCIVSSKRLHKGSSKQVISRIQKVACHELGHNLGLNHCTSSMPCVMVDAVEKLSTVDQAPLDLCSVCRSKIGMNKSE